MDDDFQDIVDGKFASKRFKKMNTGTHDLCLDGEEEDFEIIDTGNKNIEDDEFD